MNTLARTILALFVAGCLLMLWLSIWPGLLADIAFAAVLSAVFWVPALLVVGAVCLVVWLRRRKRGSTAASPRRLLIAGILVGIITLALIQSYVPRRIAFALSRGPFEAAAADVPTLRAEGAEVNRRLGIFWVDRYAADPRGGVYFRVRTGPDGIGPDVMSYGFVLDPNPQGTPFGAARYTTRCLFDHWHWFCASDDWH